MADAEHREQHNHGSGTFVGGDVHGGFWQVFLPPYGNKTSGNPAPSKRQPEQDDEEEDDYEGVLGSVIVTAWISASAGLAVVYAVMGWPWTDREPAPGIAARIGGGLVAFYACLAAAAAFFARLAQVFELWSEQCAITAAQSRGRLVARPPASMSRAMAGLTAAASVAAELLASLYGWSSYGGQVSQRAHLARLNAAANANSARAATKKPKA
ncbi:hypothetical protein JIX56_21550 [Streptomyces sp. CA-210063]|uniref:hypothetical protein n=1 Tax=Streptomyces sp. CA-210063 TaxID=2801029 RepID=UPI00214AFCB6|nr:hypothetical protein [Streptomyces sp. CA-210063]UUU32284.1 hypothetical protein JIX56_21550 [Streptomyces sp. CA-210063]